MQLIDAATDEHIWAETYDRVLTTANVFDVQSEITRQIATALQAALTPAEEVSLVNRPTQSLAAYEAYLDAIAAARKSVELDPSYTEAWATLARAYLSRFWYTSRDPSDANEAWTAIGRARSLEPDSTVVGLMLGLYHYWVNYDYAAALIEVDRVLSLESNNEYAWAMKGWILRRPLERGAGRHAAGGRPRSEFGGEHDGSRGLVAGPGPLQGGSRLARCI